MLVTGWHDVLRLRRDSGTILRIAAHASARTKADHYTLNSASPEMHFLIPMRRWLSRPISSETARLRKHTQ